MWEELALLLVVLIIGAGVLLPNIGSIFGGAEVAKPGCATCPKKAAQAALDATQ